MDQNIFPQPSEFDCKVYPLIGGYYFDELIKSIDEAKTSIFVIQYQWKWTSHQQNSKVQKLGAGIYNAKNRGVNVSVILNRESPIRSLTKINRVTSENLIKFGCDVRMIKTVSILHTKMWVIDGQYIFIGSHNISGRALSINEEVSVKIESKLMAKYMLIYFNNLWQS